MTNSLTILELICRLLRALWTVTFHPQREVYTWRRPDGFSSDEYESVELLELPYQVLLDMCLEAGR
jgi:hypothetical protein